MKLSKKDWLVLMQSKKIKLQINTNLNSYTCVVKKYKGLFSVLIYKSGEGVVLNNLWLPSLKELANKFKKYEVNII
jgi:hypothetical protein